MYEDARIISRYNMRIMKDAISPAVIVTGASRGIGRGIAIELATRGYSVAVNFRNNEAAALETVGLCTEAASNAGQRFIPVQADISIAADRSRLVKEAFSAFGRIRALINNAGIAPRQRLDITEATTRSFDEVIGTNLAGPYFLTQEVVREWLSGDAESTTGAPGGITDGAPGAAPRQIIFVTSISAETVSTSRGDYCIAKAGLAMAVKLWAARLAEENIQVLEVRPGIMETDMTSGVKGKYDELIAGGLVPQKRWGNPVDVARICRAIVDGDLGFSTGSVIHSDGGFHLSVL